MIDGVEINSTTTGAYDFANLTTETSTASKSSAAPVALFTARKPSAA